MKIALFGSTGMVGQRILAEAQQRGHSVTELHGHNSDIFSEQNVAESVTGADLVISAFGPGPEHAEKLVDATKSLLAGVAAAGIRRVIAVGGAGSLEVAPGVMLVDTPQFPAEWKPIAQAHAEALKLYEQSARWTFYTPSHSVSRFFLDWTVVAPAALLEPGTRTGQYRTSLDQLLRGEDGQSRISAEDFAVAILDEAESPKHLQQRFAVAY